MADGGTRLGTALTHCSSMTFLLGLVDNSIVGCGTTEEHLGIDFHQLYWHLGLLGM